MQFIKLYYEEGELFIQAKLNRFRIWWCSQVFTSQAGFSFGTKIIIRDVLSHD
jgi:hypothetical protein